MNLDTETQLREFCAHIVEWGERIPIFVGKKSYHEFSNDELTYLAVWKCVEVLGEASFRILKIDSAFAERYPGLQLKDAYGMRNRLTHGYSDVDLTILWSTIHDFVPPMVTAAKAILGSNAASKVNSQAYSRNYAGPWRRTPGRLAGTSLVRLYQLTLSGFIGNTCRHLPTCSEYAYEAIARHGLWAGGWMGVFRVMRCGPGGTHGIDNVPATLEAKHVWYLP